MNVDILGREIHDGDFVIHTAGQIGLRVGVVLNANVPQTPGSAYPRKKCSVLSLDYRDKNGVMKSTTTPDSNRIIICDCIPDKYKKILLDVVEEKYSA